MPNCSLFLHIGHHKTGTSTLQRRIFPQLTTVAYFLKKSPVTLAIKKAFSREDRPTPFWRQSGQEIFANLMAELSGRGAAGAALISSEGMSAPRFFASPSRLSNKFRRDPSLLADHVRECQAAAVRAGFADLKVIIGIRRQDQYLGSRYATHGFMADDPGQTDFERQTLEIIDPTKRYFTDGVWLDYKATRDRIVSALGVDGVLILPLEQLATDQPSYFAALGRFLGEAIEPDGEAGHRENVRSVAPDTWRCGKGSGQDVPLTAFERKVENPLAAGFEIRLGTALKSKILATYEDSNRRLASDIGTDLARYGYY